MKSINDFRSETVEIEIKCPTGVDAEKLVDALYAFTDCEVTIASRITVIRDNRPVEMTVSDVLRYNTEQLVAILKKELPLVVGVLADLSGNPEQPLPKLRQRKFVEIETNIR